MGERPVISLHEAGVSLLDCEHRTPPPCDTGFPYIAIPQIRQGRLDLTGVRRISREHFVEWTRKTRPQPYDVILSRRCNPGETAFVPPGLECALGQNLVLLRADGTKVFPPFLRWLVRGPDWWEQIGRFLNAGAVFDSLKCANIPEFELPIPPLPEQHTIARILGALDDKIEQNRKMNETLEAMARAIFKSWFVDFDPVRAKAAGEPPDSICRRLRLTPEILSLFPDRLQDSELGEIPEGWEISILGDLLELAYGRALKKEDREHGDIPVYGSNGQVGWHDEMMVAGPGIIVGRKGNPGLVTWSHTDFVVIDTAFYVIPSARCNSLYYLFHALDRQNLPSLAADSAVPGLNRNIAYISRLLVPDRPILEAFDVIIRPLFQLIHSNAIASLKLSETRDALLPRLLSGQGVLPIPDES